MYGAGHLVTTTFWQQKPDPTRSTYNHLFWQIISFSPVEEICQTEFPENASLLRNYFPCLSILPLSIKGHDSHNKHPCFGWEGIRTLGFALANGLIRGLTCYPNSSSSNHSVSPIVQWELHSTLPVKGTLGHYGIIGLDQWVVVWWPTATKLEGWGGQPLSVVIPHPDSSETAWTVARICWLLNLYVSDLPTLIQSTVSKDRAETTKCFVSGEDKTEEYVFHAQAIPQWTRSIEIWCFYLVGGVISSELPLPTWQ